MANSYFQFKQFRVQHDRCLFKVGTDSVLLGSWANLPATGRVLDVGTGSGLLALMTAQRTLAQVDAVEIDPGSARQAQENINTSRWKDRVRVHEGSFQEFTRTCTIHYDHVLSNPPYFVNSLKAPDPGRSLARHTVSLEFDELVAGVARVLSDEGKFSLVLPYTAGMVFVALAVSRGLYCTRQSLVIPVKGREPNRVLLEFTRTRQPTLSGEVVIRKEPGGPYTREYKDLTRDFYLGF